MEVLIISNTIQKFNGESFYKCGQYFQHKGKRLHRAVWEYHNGEIPKGYHVHHKDGNRNHNDISNLSIMQDNEHVRYHMSRPEVIKKSKISIETAREYAVKWHKSEDGALWHSKHAKEYWAKAPLQTYKCDFCGKEYQTKSVRHKGKHFCCNNCKAAYRRRRLRNES